MNRTTQPPMSEHIPEKTLSQHTAEILEHPGLLKHFPNQVSTRISLGGHQQKVDRKCGVRSRVVFSHKE